MRIGDGMKTWMTAGWGNLVSLFHLYIINHLTQEFLGCINTKQDCSSGQRECSMFYFNEGSRLLLASLWRPLFDLTFLRLSTSYDQRWGVARKKVWWTGSWQLVQLWNQLITSCMTWVAHLLESQNPQHLDKCVSFPFLYPQHPACAQLE